MKTCLIQEIDFPSEAEMVHSNIVLNYKLNGIITRINPYSRRFLIGKKIYSIQVSTSRRSLHKINPALKECGLEALSNDLQIEVTLLQQKRYWVTQEIGLRIYCYKNLRQPTVSLHMPYGSQYVN